VGRFVANRLWFFTAYRDWGVYQYIANSFFKTRRANCRRRQHPERMVRLTAQITPKNKFAVYLDRIREVPRAREFGAGRLRDRR